PDRGPHQQPLPLRGPGALAGAPGRVRRSGGLRRLRAQVLRPRTQPGDDARAGAEGAAATPPGAAGARCVGDTAGAGAFGRGALAGGRRAGAALGRTGEAGPLAERVAAGLSPHADLLGARAGEGPVRPARGGGARADLARAGAQAGGAAGGSGGGASLSRLGGATGQGTVSAA